MNRLVKRTKLYYFSILLFVFESGYFYVGSLGTSAGFTMYYRSELLDGSVCRPEHVVFDAEGVTNWVKCGVLCSKNDLCFGIFYRPEEGKCTCCSYFFNTTTLSQAGTRYFGRKGYRVIGENLTWTEAKMNCTARGGKLASINSLLEHQVVDQIIEKLSNGAVFHVWIGGNDLATEGTFLWEDGTALLDTSFSNWLPDQPNNHLSNQDCIQLYKENGKWQWNDENCSVKFISLCELD